MSEKKYPRIATTGSLETVFVPVTIAELPESWITEKREIIARDGYAVRRNGRTLEARSLRTDTWHPIGAHHGAAQFPTEQEAELVLQQLQGGAS